MIAVPVIFERSGYLSPCGGVAYWVTSADSPRVSVAALFGLNLRWITQNRDFNPALISAATGQQNAQLPRAGRGELMNLRD